MLSPFAQRSCTKRLCNCYTHVARVTLHVHQVFADVYTMHCGSVFSGSSLLIAASERRTHLSFRRSVQSGQPVERRPPVQDVGSFVYTYR